MKKIINAIQKVIEQEKLMCNLYSVIEKPRNSDCIKIKIPKEYFRMILALAVWGIDDVDVLRDILNKSQK